VRLSSLILCSFFADDWLESHRSHSDFYLFSCIGTYFWVLAAWALLIKIL
jgi:hypothetical protein